MRVLRFKKDGIEKYGWVHEGLIGEIDGDPFGDYRRKEAYLPLDEVEILPPTEPSKIVCVGRNYAAHAAEHQADIPEIPLLFLKPPSALLGHLGNIILPPQSKQVEYEAELAVVIGKKMRWATPEDAESGIFGYTIANDVTARDLQRSDGQWTRGKGFDTFCPIGPWVDTTLIPSDSLITCRVNNEVRQLSSTRDMIFPVNHLLAFISSVMTLNVGDVILTGTPAGVGVLNDGDHIEIEIEGIGILENNVCYSNRKIG